MRRGEPVIAIHFDNRAIAALTATAPNARRLTWELARIAVLDLRELAALRRAGGFPSSVRIAWAETLFYTALARYGFSTLPAPRAPRTPFARLFMLSLLAIYGRPSMLNDERARHHLQLGEAWIDLDELERRFPPVPDIAVD